jgi:hypothetical protein
VPMIWPAATGSPMATCCECGCKISCEKPSASVIAIVAYLPCHALVTTPTTGERTVGCIRLMPFKNEAPRFRMSQMKDEQAQVSVSTTLRSRPSPIRVPDRPVELRRPAPRSIADCDQGALTVRRGIERRRRTQYLRKEDKRRIFCRSSDATLSLSLREAAFIEFTLRLIGERIPHPGW